MSKQRDRDRLAQEREDEGSSLAEDVRRLMPELTADLVRLARIPSIAFPWGSEPVTRASGGSIPLLSALHAAVPGLPPVLDTEGARR